MATNAGAGAARQLASARKPTAVWKKYTIQSHGVWERIRRALAIDPERSNGVPLNPQYRNPPPGANPPQAYDDPVTIPSGDIAENPYYKRDIRRNYPRLSVVNQADVVGLLSMGSKANPKEDVLQIGDAGAKQLVQVKQQGEENGLAALFEKDKKTVTSIFGPDGLPPFPSGMSRASAQGGKRYVMDADRAEGYPEEPNLIPDLFPDLTSVSSFFITTRQKILKGEAMATPLYLYQILSCVICQDTVPDIYPDVLRRGPPKMWILEDCCHVVCGKHLTGEDFPPRAVYPEPRLSCPFCGAPPQALYFFYDIDESQHHIHLPTRIFNRLFDSDGSEESNNAMKYQCTALAHYYEMTNKKAPASLMDADREMRHLLAGMATTLDKVKDANSALECRNQALQIRNEFLESELRKWDHRRTGIIQALQGCATLVDGLLRARLFLLRLNEDTSDIDRALEYARGQTLRTYTESQPWGLDGPAAGILAKSSDSQAEKSLHAPQVSSTGFIYRSADFQDMPGHHVSTLMAPADPPGLPQRRSHYLREFLPGARPFHRGSSQDAMHPPPVLSSARNQEPTLLDAYVRRSKVKRCNPSSSSDVFETDNSHLDNLSFKGLPNYSAPYTASCLTSEIPRQNLGQLDQRIEAGQPAPQRTPTRGPAYSLFPNVSTYRRESTSFTPRAGLSSQARSSYGNQLMPSTSSDQRPHREPLGSTGANTSFNTTEEGPFDRLIQASMTPERRQVPTAQVQPRPIPTTLTLAAKRKADELSPEDSFERSARRGRAEANTPDANPPVVAASHNLSTATTDIASAAERKIREGIERSPPGRRPVRR